MPEEPKAIVTFLVPPELAERIKEAAKRQGKTVSQMFRQIAEQMFPISKSDKILSPESAKDKILSDVDRKPAGDKILSMPPSTPAKDKILSDRKRKPVDPDHPDQCPRCGEDIIWDGEQGYCPNRCQVG
jgi:hypothetical protein